MPKVSKFTEEQVRAFLAQAFGAKCGGEGEGVGVEAVAELTGIGVNTLYIWKRKYFPDQTVKRAPRKVIRKTPAAAKVAHANGAEGKSLDAKGQLRRLFMAWVEASL